MPVGRADRDFAAHIQPVAVYFDDTEWMQLYPTHEDYVAKYAAVADNRA